MIVDRQFHNIKCDYCGRLLDEETWWDDKDALTTQILPECGWIECKDRHYCDECWTWVDDDKNIVTEDGRKWDGDTHKEILSYRLSYLDGMDESLTLTQFRFRMIQAMVLFNSMVGTLYKGMLADELEVAQEMFRRMIRDRYGSEEHGCYLTFVARGIFAGYRRDAEERLYNRKNRGI